MTTTTSAHVANGQAALPRIGRRSHLEWVRVGDTRVPEGAQRDYRPSFAEKLARNFDPDKLGFPVVSLRDGVYWVTDGQHRIGALRLIAGDDQLVQCEVFTNNTLAEDAESFLGRQERLKVLTIDEFRVAITAGRARECDIDRIVRAQGLRIAAGSTITGGIQAVAALGFVYDKGGPVLLGKTLRIIRDAFGVAAMSGGVIRGIGLLCLRYQGALFEEETIKKLSAVRGGVNGLTTRGAVLRKQTGRPVPHCTAAAAVEFINAGKGGRKLTDWWKMDADSEVG